MKPEDKFPIRVHVSPGREKKNRNIQRERKEPECTQRSRNALKSPETSTSERLKQTTNTSMNIPITKKNPKKALRSSPVIAKSVKIPGKPSSKKETQALGREKMKLAKGKTSKSPAFFSNKDLWQSLKQKMLFCQYYGRSLENLAQNASSEGNLRPLTEKNKKKELNSQRVHQRKEKKSIERDLKSTELDQWRKAVVEKLVRNSLEENKSTHAPLIVH